MAGQTLKELAVLLLAVLLLAVLLPLPAWGGALDRGPMPQRYNPAADSMLRVPGVVGLYEQEAMGVLQQAGLNVDVVYERQPKPDLAGREGTVIEQVPATAGVAMLGSSVTIRVYLPPESTPSGPSGGDDDFGDGYPDDGYGDENGDGYGDGYGGSDEGLYDDEDREGEQREPAGEAAPAWGTPSVPAGGWTPPSPPAGDSGHGQQPARIDPVRRGQLVPESGGDAAPSGGLSGRAAEGPSVDPAGLERVRDAAAGGGRQQPLLIDPVRRGQLVPAGEEENGEPPVFQAKPLPRQPLPDRREQDKRDEKTESVGQPSLPGGRVRWR